MQPKHSGIMTKTQLDQGQWAMCYFDFLSP